MRSSDSRPAESPEQIYKIVLEEIVAGPKTDEKDDGRAVPGYRAFETRENDDEE